MAARYLVALGSNVRHPRHGSPPRVLAAALAALADAGLRVERASPVIASAPVGPSLRRYANACAVVESDLAPEDLLARLQAIESAFGRRRMGERWRSRVLDLDIVLWDGGPWSSPGLTIPHREFRHRAFVLGPASRIAGGWRDPITGLRLRHLSARLTRRRPLPIRAVEGP